MANVRGGGGGGGDRFPKMPLLEHLFQFWANEFFQARDGGGYVQRIQNILKKGHSDKGSTLSDEQLFLADTP